MQEELGRSKRRKHESGPILVYIVSRFCLDNEERPYEPLIITTSATRALDVADRIILRERSAILIERGFMAKDGTVPHPEVYSFQNLKGGLDAYIDECRRYRDKGVSRHA